MSSTTSDDQLERLSNDLAQVAIESPPAPSPTAPSSYGTTNSEGLVGDEREVEEIMSPTKSRLIGGRSESRASGTSSSASVRQCIAAGPRVNRAAALRQGIAYSAPDASSRRRSVVNFGTTPGHKRDDLKLNVPSLAPPTVTPRVNRATRIRMSVAAGGSGGRDLLSSPSVPLGTASPSRANQATTAGSPLKSNLADSNKRRPVSMMARMGPTTPSKRESTATIDSNDMKMRLNAKEALGEDAGQAVASTKSARRRTMAVPLPLSLEPPAITPRSNRTAALRTSSAAFEFDPISSQRRALDRQEVKAKEKTIYEGVPGHKQKSKRVVVKSVAEPEMQSRRFTAPESFDGFHATSYAGIQGASIAFDVWDVINDFCFGEAIDGVDSDV